MMDDTLIIVSLEPMRMVTKHNRKSLRALEKFQESFTVPASVS